MNIHFWFKGQYAIESGTARTSLLPPTARIQTGEPGVWPWAEECKKQLEGLGSNALAYVGPSRYRPAPSHEKILSAARLLRDLAECDSQPILFQARRKPRSLEERIKSGETVTISACELRKPRQ